MDGLHRKRDEHPLDSSEKKANFASGLWTRESHFHQMKTLKTGCIIHLFAVTHVIATLSCRASGIDDPLLLTLLTMLMILIICFRKKVSVEFTAAYIVIANIAGYLTGMGVADLIGNISRSPLTVHAVSTFITTELLGWTIILLTRIFRVGHRKSSWTPRIRWLIAATAVIFLIRLAYTEIFNSRYFTAESSYRIIRMLLGNSFAILLAICLNIIYIRFMRRHGPKKSIYWKTILFTAFVLTVSVVTALLAGYGLPFRFNNTLTWNEFILLLTVSILAQLGIYCIIYIIDLALAARKSMFEEREKAHQAQYRYLKLKQQVNPHFLFNSLNILDCLVCEHKDGQASSYIHKLAGIYRYMLQNEADAIVPLNEELTFIQMYADLLKIRFRDGFSLEIDIPEEYMEYRVVPCSIQMLVENAIKHNTVSEDNVLHIRITSDGNTVSVTNNINPKLSGSSSTGIGLANIRQQYMDLTGSSIEISDSGGYYRVSIPLIGKYFRRALK